ncbi:Bcr/CflA family efflux MFS transporter [Kineococcus sp. T13]|nr:Bcr/CflA family efflux MFS transporter [Kineococcus vitellinus]
MCLALLCAIGPLAIDTYLPTLPRLADDLSTSASSVQLTLTTFMVGMAVGQLVLGPASDRLGRRGLLLAGTAVTCLAGVACALAPSIELLLAARFVQGFAGAAGMVIGRAVIADLASGRAAARAFAIFGVVQGVAPVLAPLLGGVLAGPVGWRGTFAVGAAVAALLVLASALLVRETLPPERRHDGGARAVAASVRAVLARRGYVGHVATLVAVFAALFAYVSASPFVLQHVVGLSTGTYSLVFTLNACGIVAGGATSARLLRRRSPSQVLAAGVLLQLGSAAALLVVVVLADAWAPGVLVLLWLLVYGAGLSFGNATALAADEVRFASGTGSALQGALQFGVGALVSPLVGLGGEGTAVPMAVVVLVCAAAAAAALFGVARPALRARAAEQARGAGTARPAEGG